MEEIPLRVTGQYNIASSFKSIAAAGPESKPYLIMSKDVGMAVHKRGRSAIVTLDYNGTKYPTRLLLADPNITHTGNYLVFLSFDHHRMRITGTTGCEVLMSYHSRALVLMNNVDSELIYGVPKRKGPDFRCWIDDLGCLCQESMEVTSE